MSKLNNEQVGISAELAIADTYGVSIAPNYRARGVEIIEESIKPIIEDIFQKNNIPLPVRHLAERQNKVDFELADGRTLSVKTNKQKLGKVAPQEVGQASSQTWFSLLADRLGILEVPASYQERVELFKTIVMAKTAKLLSIYWEFLFDCDFLVQIFNVVDSDDRPTGDPKYIVMKKVASPVWDPDKISFTRSNLDEWNESNTVKYAYAGVTIGEFQVHNYRDNFKFRFDMAGIVKLIEDGQLKFE